MGIGFYFPAKAGATTSWIPLKQPVFPAEEPVDYPEQLTGETAGGMLYVQDKGTKRESFGLRFARLTLVDRNNALNFFNTVKKSFSTFEYEDRNQVLHAVRWTSDFDFPFVIEGRYSGTINLRKETA
ncbi:hypothetical protein MNBD_NITROSPINAE05-1439 [hydrothermal vent metagenome]|uniref:Uncharacterized protein n=1 Tax=hydrothermal vent metagenome TaxID=652676 RepID=A0A3B1CA29_9ZZZZ